MNNDQHQDNTFPWRPNLWIHTNIDDNFEILSELQSTRQVESEIFEFEEDRSTYVTNMHDYQIQI